MSCNITCRLEGTVDCLASVKSVSDRRDFLARDILFDHLNWRMSQPRIVVDERSMIDMSVPGSRDLLYDRSSALLLPSRGRDTSEALSLSTAGCPTCLFDYCAEVLSDRTVTTEYWMYE